MFLLGTACLDNDFVRLAACFFFRTNFFRVLFLNWTVVAYC
jgi:hypothetical protein